MLISPTNLSRSLLYYIFLAVMTLFVNLLRDSKQPRAREDLQSLNMAATFFTTLIPGDGPYNYAKFMARMCTNFERIARVVIERTEKAVKSRGESAEKPSQPQPRGRQTPKPSKQTHTPQLIPSTGSSANPNLEGLPPINTSSYTVPETPSTSTILAPDTNTNPNPVFNTALQTQNQTPAPESLDPIVPTTPDNTNTLVPWPDFWQIPLTADWEFGNQFPTGLLTSDYPQYQPATESFLPTTPAPMSMPPSGYFGGQQDPNLGQGQGASMWLNGFSGSF